MFTLDPHDACFLDTLDFFLKLFGGIGALYLFLIGLRRYVKDQTWKRNDFVAKEIKEFTADKMVRNTMFMLDWGTRSIRLFHEKSTGTQELFIRFNKDIKPKADLNSTEYQGI